MTGPVRANGDSDFRGHLQGEALAPPGRLRVLRVDHAVDAPADQLATSIAAEESESELLQQRRRLLAGREHALIERVHELERLEAKLDERQAELEQHEAKQRIAIELEQEALAAREQELEELAARLASKERQVADYVSKAQKQLARVASETATARPDSRASWRRRTNRT